MLSARSFSSLEESKARLVAATTPVRRQWHEIEDGITNPMRRTAVPGGMWKVWSR